MVRCCFSLGLLSTVAAHSSLIKPRPFNAIDILLPEFQGGKSPVKWEDGLYDCQCWNGTDVCDIGQTCYYFSNGCTIGCTECDGEAANPNTRDRCGSGMTATLDPKFRTFNRHTEPGSDEDIYKHNPWRAPGNAPLLDPCGMASGGHHETGGHGEYTNTKYAKVGDKGSELQPRIHSGAVWAAGSVVEAAWSLRANHGGGYQYRLCPKAWPLTEACFQATPVPFAGNSSLLEVDDGKRVEIDSVFVSDGTQPQGSTWAMNPIPYAHLHRNWDANNPPEFEPPFEGTGCAGNWPMTTIYDKLRVPAYLEPGEYVLGFRYDCEKSAQVWNSCADITITAPVAVAV